MTRRQSLGTAVAAALPTTAFAATPQPPMKLIVLDIGGTIVQDRGNIPELLAGALAHYGIDSTPAEIDQRRGGSKREIIRYFVQKQTLPATADRDKIIASAYDRFTTETIAVYRTVPPVAGAEDAIREMVARGYLVATTTGFDRPITDSIFTRLGWSKYFIATVCSDEVAAGRPAPYMLFHAMELAKIANVAEVMAVGDTPLDLQAGTNGGMRAVVGVLTGAATEAKLRAQPHTHILQSVANLPALLATKP